MERAVHISSDEDLMNYLKIEKSNPFSMMFYTNDSVIVRKNIVSLLDEYSGNPNTRCILLVGSKNEYSNLNFYNHSYQNLNRFKDHWILENEEEFLECLINVQSELEVRNCRFFHEGTYYIDVFNMKYKSRVLKVPYLFIIIDENYGFESDIGVFIRRILTRINIKGRSAGIVFCTFSNLKGVFI